MCCKKKDKELSAQTKGLDAKAALENKVNAIRLRNKQPEEWDKKDLTTMVSWFKRPGDKALPGNKFQLLRHNLLTCNHCKEDCSMLKYGEVPVLTDDDDNNVVPLPLLPIADDNANGLPKSA